MLNQLLLFLILIALAVVIFLLLRKKTDKPDDKSLMMLQELNSFRQTLDSKLSESTKHMQNQFSESAKIIRDVTIGLTKLDSTNQQVLDFSKQLQSLENILKNPKQRGILGEYYLEELLKNVFQPNQYKTQYAFKDGKIVDAVIFLKDKIIPIDSKFSLENYNRLVQEQDPDKRLALEKQVKNDLKTRIDETAKYIRPQEGTYDFAFMFIPAEAIYYDLLVNKIGTTKVNTRDLIDYATREKHVHIVSPTSFYAYLQTILEGLRALQIEESAKLIHEKVVQLGKHLNSYEAYMKKLGNNLGTTVNMYNSAYKELGKIDKDVTKITQGQSKMTPKQLDKPKTDDLD